MRGCEFVCPGKRALNENVRLIIWTLLRNYFETKIPQASTEHIAMIMRQLL